MNPTETPRSIFLAAVSAALLSASYPPWDLSVLAWVALVPLLLAVERGGLGSVFLTCWIFGFLRVLFLFHWILQSRVIPAPASFLIMGYLALFQGLFGVSCRLLSGNLSVPLVLAAPVSWVASEFLQSRAGFLAFPLNLLGHSQHARLDIIQVADIGGVYVVSFLVVFVNAALLVALSFLLDRENRKVEGVSPRAAAGSAVAALAIVLAALLYGRWGDVATDPDAQPEITVVQGNISQENIWSRAHRKENLEQYIRLTESAAGGGTSLVVWPESAIPGPLATDLGLFIPVYRLVKRIEVPILAGSSTIRKSHFKNIGEPPGVFNSAYLVSRDGRIAGRYDKIRLVPFREYVPLPGIIPWPETIRRFSAQVLPGTTAKAFDGGGYRFGVAICWDSLYPEVFRRIVGEGAGFVVNISNEAMFGETAASHQLLAMTVFRAVENRVPIVRASNSGLSCFIGPRGEIVDWVRGDGKDLLVEGTLTRRVPVRRTSTFYANHGDLFAGGCAIVTAALLLAGIVTGIRKTPAEKVAARPLP